MTLLDSVFARGFDNSYRDERDELGRFSKAVTVRCSQCDALVICGVPTHERGCPNTPVACLECGTVHSSRAEAAACCAPVPDDYYVDPADYFVE